MSNHRAVDLFSEWAEKGRDVGMEKGHSKSVKKMISLAKDRISGHFSAIDVGCGNGWAMRELQSVSGCLSASGVDGSDTMISKAKLIHPQGDYFHGMLPKWIPEKPVDLVMSMEFMYYLKNPLDFLSSIHDAWLKKGGWLVFGVDHYRENPPSLGWPDSLKLELATLSESQWESGMVRAGFVEVQTLRFGKEDDWEGTLVVLGKKR